MIGLHINNYGEQYSDNHAQITREINDMIITIAYHDTSKKQVFYEDNHYLIMIDGWIFNSPSYLDQAYYTLELYKKYGNCNTSYPRGHF